MVDQAAEAEREEEFRHSCVRPAAVIEVRSGVDADGKIAACDSANLNS